MIRTRLKNIQIALVIMTLIFVEGCQNYAPVTSNATLKSELFAVEKEFCAMAQSEGIQKAFFYFAADSAVLLRGNQLVKGKTGIFSHYISSPQTGVKLEWVPDFADVSISGDLGYTYGKYTYSTSDSTGHRVQTSGIFHTVWKRQKSGQWRFVWD